MGSTRCGLNTVKITNLQISWLGRGMRMDQGIVHRFWRSRDGSHDKYM
uniref:Uncharacterized protein n=1 Tax=Arundo donax TaxID=35708 RepID=A0A0A9B8I9_ARUDO